MSKKIPGWRPPNKPKPPQTPAKVRIDTVALDASKPGTRLPGAVVSLHGDVGGAQVTNPDGWAMWEIDADKKGKRVVIRYERDGFTPDEIVLDPWDGQPRLSPNHYEKQLVPLAPEVPDSPRRGVVRGEGKKLVDDGGAFLAIMHTQFWLPWAMAFDRDRGLKNLDHLIARGSHGPRIFGVIGDGGTNVSEDSWYDRCLNPGVNGWPVWLDGIRDTLEALRERHARAIITIFGTTGRLSRNDRGRVVSELAGLLTAFREQVLYIEISNEDKVGRDESAEHIATLKARLPGVLVTDTAAHWGGGSNVCAQHPERKVTGEGGMWEHCEQMYEAFVLSGAPSAGSVQEPIGPQSSVAEDDDPARLVADAVTGFVCGAPVYVYHAGAGIRGGGEADRNRGRCANFWEHPTLDATLKGLVAATAMLPADTSAIGHVTHSHPKNGHQNGGYFPFETGPLEPLCPDGFLKLYCCSEGRLSGRFAGSLLNITKDIPLQAPARMSLRVAEFAGADGSVELTLEAGQTFTVKSRGGIYVTGAFA